MLLCGQQVVENNLSINSKRGEELIDNPNDRMGKGGINMKASIEELDKIRESYEAEFDKDNKLGILWAITIIITIFYIVASLSLINYSLFINKGEISVPKSKISVSINGDISEFDMKRRSDYIELSDNGYAVKYILSYKGVDVETDSQDNFIRSDNYFIKAINKDGTRISLERDNDIGDAWSITEAVLFILYIIIAVVIILKSSKIRDEEETNRYRKLCKQEALWRDRMKKQIKSDLT